MERELDRTPLLDGMSGAGIFRVRGERGSEWIEKRGIATEIRREAEITAWCAERLPVAKVLEVDGPLFKMSVLSGLNLTAVPVESAVAVIVEALTRIHSMPARGCPFDSSWAVRLQQAAVNVNAALVDESDFDDANLGRSAAEVLAELRGLPPLPELSCFTHGDACLPNFLSHGGVLTGIVDLGRAGVTHPAQDWALALRSMRHNFGADGERLLREHLPEHSTDEELLRRFRLLDELF